MVKKILLASALLAAIPAISFANSCPYLGASVGISTNTTSSAATGVLNSVVQYRPANFRGVPFSGFIGYGGIIDQNFYLAAEIFGTAATAEISNNFGVKTTWGYGASILPGVMLSDHTLAFARLGALRTRFSDSTTNTQTGGQIGLGLQTSVTQNIDLRGEYDFTAYRSFNNSFGRVSSPRQDAVNLGLIYKFD